MNLRSCSVALCALSAAIVGTPALADLAQFGNPTSANGFPFGLPLGNDYQQVYAATYFGQAPVSVDTIIFQAENGGGLPAGGTFTFSLSVTSAQVDHLDTVNLANNVGTHQRRIYSRDLASVFDGTFLAVHFAPYIYDPSAGNLLLEVKSFDTTIGGASFMANAGDANGIYSRAYNFGTGDAGYGLVTTFDINPPAAVPEPASWAMMLGGFGLTGGAMRSRRKTAVSFG